MAVSAFLSFFAGAEGAESVELDEPSEDDDFESDAEDESELVDAPAFLDEEPALRLSVL